MKKFYSSLAMLAVLPALASCGDDGNGLIPVDVPGLDQCKLECKGVVEANGSVSGIASVDAFFTSALNFRGQASVLEADVRGTLAEMALALGLNASGSAADIAGRIEGHIEGGFGGKIDGGITIDFEPPRCEVSAEATVQAAARCDAEVNPGSATVECKGGCVIEAEASCDGELKCTGKAPSFACEGSCEGSCELNAGVKCEGTCSGTCELDGTAACDGECMGDTDNGGNCTGECKLNAGAKCEGECKGSCELTGGAQCEGQCKGTCTYEPGSASCDGELTCEASAGAECKGECKGEVVPPSVKAECDASVKAEANFQAECSPPSLAVDYQLNAAWAAEADADAKLEFEAQLQGFVRAFGKLQAKGAKLKLVAQAGADLVGAAEGAVKGVVEGLEGSSTIRVKIGAACAVAALGGTQDLLGDASASVSASVDAVGTVTGAVGG